jgi:hypothetical protein
MTELAQRHGPDCTAGADGGPCVRCMGFQPGNLAALKHGARSVLTLAKRTAEIRERLVDVAPVVADADAAAFDLAALTLAQVEVASLLIQRVRREQLDAVALGEKLTAEDLQAHARLAQDARGWINTSMRLLRELGCSPTSRVAMGADAARIDSELSLAALREQGRLIRERLEAEDSAEGNDA